MNAEDFSLELFEKGYNCAQAVFCSQASKTGLDEDTMLRISTGFGGGMGRTGKVCGAATGGVLALSAIIGQNPGEPKAMQTRTYTKVQEFLSAFEKIHGHTDCSAILDGTNLMSPEGQDHFRSSGLRSKCQTCISGAVKILENLTTSHPAGPPPSSQS
jgi:C_GCAxxG_C_C family probable redox protein